MAVTPEFVQLCHDFRKQDTLPSKFANTVNSRLDTSHYPSFVGGLGDNPLPDKEALQNQLTNYYSVNKNYLSHFDEYKEGFRAFIVGVHAYVSERFREDPLTCDLFDNVTSGKTPQEILMYHTYVVLACRCYLLADNKDDWKSLGTFVHNIVTRSYRVPRLARYLNAVGATLSEFTPPSDQQDYLILKDLILNSTT